uniref:Uncharacterized protein LOC111115920 isoform X5 n=1 Tax=Crassostrea virginica TaxID=6565 RepID=A0A8B8C4N6_CRAVI|nr:uncharacterized protein LOC111115920 isoform X5 [Crassostrea virginica]
MASTSYAATKEMTNINRVSRLLMDPCTDQLRDLLRFYIPPANFNSVIQTAKSRLPRLTEPQRKLILPNSGMYSGNYDDMDISLLYILLRNVCGIQAHNKGWGNTSDSADRSVSANIERFRLARNRCGHSTGGMSNSEFNQVWSEIRAAVVDLDKTLGIGNKYQEAVDFIRNDTMDPTKDRHFRDQLLEQIIETENIKKDVHILKTKTKENDEQVTEVKQDIIKLESSQKKIDERNIPLNIQEKRTYKYALVLFDYDGFTAVVETKRLEDYDGDLERSQMCTIHYECKLQSVEILDLSETEEGADEQDTMWGRSHRARAISKERKHREEENSQHNKYGGYCTIWPDDAELEMTLDSNTSFTCSADSGWSGYC